MISRRGLLLAGAGAAFAGPVAGGELVPGDSLEEIQKRGSIRIGAYRDFAPYSFVDNGGLRGTDIDVAKLIAEGLQVTCEPELRNASENVDADLRGHVWRGPVEGNVVNIMLHMPIAHDLAARNDMVAMGAAYAGEKTVLCWSKFRIGEIPNMVTFKDNPIAVNVNSLADSYLASFAGGALVPNIVHRQSLAEAVDAMVNEDAYAVMGSINEIEWALQKYPDKRERYIVAKMPPPGLSLGTWAYGLAVRTNYRDLYYAVDGIIEAALADGRIKAIYESYGLTYTPPPVVE